MASLDDVTRIRITARDETETAFRSVGRGLSEMKAAFGAVQAQIASLVGVAGIGLWAKDVISAASALDDLADATGSSVESLSKLSNIAKVSGADFATIDAAIKKLAVGMAGVDEESSRAGKALAAIGVSARDPAQALTEIAQKFATYEDGAGKAALAVAIFGKSGASLLPILKDIAANVDIVGTTTTEQAKAAEDLEKAYRRMGVEATGFKNILLSEVVPALTATISSFNLAKAAGLGLFDSLSLVGNYGADGIASAIASMTKEVERLRAAEKNATSESWAEKFAKDLDVAEKKLRALKAIRDSMERPGWDAAYPSRNSSGRTTAAPTIPGADPKSKAAIDWYLKGLDDIAAALKREDEERKKVIEGQRAQLELIDRLYEAQNKSIESIDKSTESYQSQIDALTKTKDELRALEIAKLQAIVDARTYEGYINDETKALMKQLDTLKKLRSVEAAKDASDASQKAAEQAAEAWQRAADSISQSLTDALMRGFEDGKSFAKNFGQTLVNLFKSMVLRPVIQAVVSPLAGAVTGAMGFSGNAAASSGGSLLSGASLFGGLGGFGSGASISMGNIGSLGLIEGSMANFANIGGQLSAGSIMPALGMVAPYIGAAVAVGSMLYSLIGKRDPSQVKGQFQVGGTGFEDNASAASRFGPLGFADANTQQFSGEVGAQFAGVIGKLLDAAAAQMTPDQVASAAAKLNATVFEAMEGTFTTQDFLNTYGADVMQQTVAVAFDELNPRLAELMRAFDGNAEEVAAYAERLIQVQAFLGDAADALGGLFAGLSVDDVLALDTAFGGLGNVMSAAAGYIGSFYTEAERLAMTTEQLRQSFADIGVAMPESNAAFRALVDSLDLTTEGGRDLFRSLMEVAPAFATVTAAAEESAQKLAQTAATLVNDLVSFDLAQASGNSAAQATIRRNALIDQFVRVTPGTEDFAGAYGGNYDAYASAIGGLSKDAFATFGEESRGLLLQIIDSVKGAAAPSGSSSAASAEPPELAKARDWSADIANAEIELLRLQGDELGVLNAQRAIELESLRDAPDALKNLSQSIYDFQKSAIEQAIAERTAQAELARIAERSRERARQSSGFDLDRILKEQADAAESAAASAESMFAASGAGYVERQVKLLDDYLDQVADKTQTATERYADLWSRLSDQLDASKIAEYGDEIVSLSERLSGSSFEFRRDAARVASVAQSRRTQLDPSASAGESERLLKEMLSEIRAGNVAIAQNTAKTAKVLQQFDGEGMPAVRT